MRLWLVASAACLRESKSLPTVWDQDLINPPELPDPCQLHPTLWPACETTFIPLPAASAWGPQAQCLPCPASLNPFLGPLKGEQKGWARLDQSGNEVAWNSAPNLNSRPLVYPRERQAPIILITVSHLCTCPEGRWEVFAGLSCQEWGLVGRNGFTCCSPTSPPVPSSHLLPNPPLQGQKEHVASVGTCDFSIIEGHVQ